MNGIFVPQILFLIICILRLIVLKSVVLIPATFNIIVLDISMKTKDDVGWKIYQLNYCSGVRLFGYTKMYEEFI